MARRDRFPRPKGWGEDPSHFKGHLSGCRHGGRALTSNSSRVRKEAANALGYMNDSEDFRVILSTLRETMERQPVLPPSSVAGHDLSHFTEVAYVEFRRREVCGCEIFS